MYITYVEKDDYFPYIRLDSYEENDRFDANCKPGKTVRCGKACRKPDNCKSRQKRESTIVSKAINKGALDKNKSTVASRVAANILESRSSRPNMFNQPGSVAAKLEQDERKSAALKALARRERKGKSTGSGDLAEKAKLGNEIKKRIKQNASNEGRNPIEVERETYQSASGKRKRAAKEKLAKASKGLPSDYRVIETKAASGKGKRAKTMALR